MEVPVLLPKIFDYPLTYKADKEKLNVGDFVEVPFGKSKEIGVVWDKKQILNKKITIRSINKKFLGIKINKSLINFINWFSIYNIAPKGLVLKMCLGKNFDLKNLKPKFKLHKVKKKMIQFNQSQKKALKELSKYDNNFRTTVLQGVTGSGKTLVYFERIKKNIEKGKQVLVLLPEIFLTNQFHKRFQDFFGFSPSIWHSKVTPKNKKIIWHGVQKGKINVIIGVRSSLFLPFKKLGLIIVDEEHDQSYKQDDGVIYNARDMAIARASFENIPVNLISSIPSLETFHNIKKRKYNHVILENRYRNLPFPESKIININIKTNKNIISPDSLKIVEKYLSNNNQVLFFLNRRGYSNFLICKNCGYKHTCPNCSIYLTYHSFSDKVVCHYCDYTRKLDKKCLINKNRCDFSKYGIGVEKVFEELKKLFPTKKIKIFSSDFLSKKKESKNLIKDIEENKVDILVGTQMISKGFNFPNLNCIVVVDADFSGNGFDLRTTEKNIQLYTQLSGRAGRFSKNSIIIYQTITPSHKTLDDLIKNKPEFFLENELVLRKENNLPPFKKLIAIIISSNIKENSFNVALLIKKKLSYINQLQILGPIEAPIVKVKKKFRTRLLIKTNNSLLNQKLIQSALQKLKISSKIKLTVDVDPINFA
tara:strand:+ start:75 stop:2021 length:1947 start_codon:yes stop_codon:yes gene_type:complete